MAKQYVGRFPVNKALTAKVNMNGWVIYRDPEIGLYAFHEESGEEINLLLWNETAKTVTEKALEFIRSEIREKEIEIKEIKRWVETQSSNPTEEALRISALKVMQG